MDNWWIDLSNDADQLLMTKLHRSSINADVRRSVGWSPFVFFQAYQAKTTWTIGVLIYLMMLINY